MSTPWQATPAHPAGPRPPRRPPLTKRLRPGHWLALDVLAAGMFTFALALTVREEVFTDGGGLPWPAHLMVSLLFGAAISFPVAIRRRRPLLAFALTLAAATAVAAISPVRGDPEYFLPAACILYLVAAVSRRKTAVVSLVTLLALLGLAQLRERLAEGFAGDTGNTIFIALIAIIAWMVGYAAGQRRAYADQLRDQAATSAVTDERLRIARELHDVVAHSMTVIAVQAGYGKHVIDGQPAQAKEALGAIQATSREALAEMRRMLGVLRQADPAPGAADRGLALIIGSDSGAGTAGMEAAAPLLPAPGLADLDRLVTRIGNTGVRVELEILGRRRDLPPGIDLSAFRIVQEALTNVVKHAAASCCRVVIEYGDSDVTVEITDDGQGCQVPASAGARGPAGAVEVPAGHGLIGMRERVGLYGGQLSAAPLDGLGFQVTARLPLEDDAP